MKKLYVPLELNQSFISLALTTLNLVNPFRFERKYPKITKQMQKWIEPDTDADDNPVYYQSTSFYPDITIGNLSFPDIANSLGYVHIHLARFSDYIRKVAATKDFDFLGHISFSLRSSGILPDWTICHHCKSIFSRHDVLCEYSELWICNCNVIPKSSTFTSGPDGDFWRIAVRPKPKSQRVNLLDAIECLSGQHRDGILRDGFEYNRQDSYPETNTHNLHSTGVEDSEDPQLERLFPCDYSNFDANLLPCQTPFDHDTAQFPPATQRSFCRCSGLYHFDDDSFRDWCICDTPVDSDEEQDTDWISPPTSMDEDEDETENQSPNDDPSGARGAWGPPPVDNGRDWELGPDMNITQLIDFFEELSASGENHMYDGHFLPSSFEERH